MQIQTINKLKELTDNRKQLLQNNLTITQKLTDLKEEDVETDYGRDGTESSVSRGRSMTWEYRAGKFAGRMEEKNI